MHPIIRLGTEHHLLRLHTAGGLLVAQPGCGITVRQDMARGAAPAHAAAAAGLQRADARW
eukprot:scaffold46493_cov61-Phaeocystis_antarctica.AAC.2